MNKIVFPGATNFIVPLHVMRNVANYCDELNSVLHFSLLLAVVLSIWSIASLKFCDASKLLVRQWGHGLLKIVS